MSFLDNMFKSPQQKEAESIAYYKWAYPFGDEHKTKIDALVRSFVSDEDPAFAVFNYLVCRQKLAPSVYEGKYKVTDDQFKPCAKVLKKEITPKGKKVMYKYMALVEADLMIDDNFNYPSLEQLNARANEIKAIIEQ